MYLLTADVALSMCGSFCGVGKEMVELNLTWGMKFNVEVMFLQCRSYISLRLSMSHFVVFSKCFVVVYAFHLPWVLVLDVGDMSMM